MSMLPSISIYVRAPPSENSNEEDDTDSDTSFLVL